MRILGGLVLGLVLLAGPAPARADEYPTKPISLVIPFGPGGASDFVARIIQPDLSTLLGQQVVIENRPGAAGNIALALVAKAAPDGYTLFLGNIGTVAVNPSVFVSTLHVDPMKDLAPITRVADTPDILIANPDFPPKSVAELIPYVKARPGQVSFASPGSGSVNRLEMELFRGIAELDMIHVPYKGGAGQAVTDVLGGHVPLMFTTLSSAISFVRTGKLRALAMTTPQRIPELPDVPTMAEQGYPDMVTASWQGLLAPAGLPPEIQRRLFDATASVLAKDEVRERLANGGAAVVVSKSPEEFASFIAAETKRWAEVVKASGAQAD
jgi:tripartite-type tricarboxylate transporter receptor subunit TctC